MPSALMRLPIEIAMLNFIERFKQPEKLRTTSITNTLMTAKYQLFAKKHIILILNIPIALCLRTIVLRPIFAGKKEATFSWAHGIPKQVHGVIVMW
ncbi:hypothetical protein NPIL_225581 [Nephila pilipes]|uniref:Uncharacterized protein n=1 Tax=Nephila pilipes TaxID=299642 RepID=A0A8X6QRY0_NEPPI|nr:hypothetical protein NPIL_225581 [Nephila pilipes]